MLTVLAGVYDLRVADAHLPSNDAIEHAMGLVGIDYNDLRLNAGKQLIENVNVSYSLLRTLMVIQWILALI